MEPNDLIEAFNWRYATKEFDPGRKLSGDQLHALLESLRLSPSSFGLQPWKFVVVEDAETRARLREIGWNQPQFTAASHLVVLCRVDEVSGDDVTRFIKATADSRGVDPGSLDAYRGMMDGFLARLDEAQRAEWTSRQIYLALGGLLTSCAVLGIDACPIEGFDPARADKILDLPAIGCHSVVICALGFRAGHDKYAGHAKVRHSSSEVVIIR